MGDPPISHSSVKLSGAISVCVGESFVLLTRVLETKKHPLRNDRPSFRLDEE